MSTEFHEQIPREPPHAMRREMRWGVPAEIGRPILVEVPSATSSKMDTQIRPRMTRAPRGHDELRCSRG
jgi:hypothetical protein